MSESREIKDVHTVVQAAIDAIDKDPNDAIQWHKPAVSQGKGTSGHADFRILYHGVWIDIECKYDMWISYPAKLSTSKSRLPTALQCTQLERTEKAGGLALVVDRHTVHLVAPLLKLIHADDEYHNLWHLLTFYYELLDDIDKGDNRKDWDDELAAINPLHWKQFARDVPEVEL